MHIQGQEIKSSQSSKNCNQSLFNYFCFSVQCRLVFLFLLMFCTLFIFPDQFSLQRAVTSHYAYPGPKSTWPFFSRVSSHSVKTTWLLAVQWMDLPWVRFPSLSNFKWLRVELLGGGRVSKVCLCLHILSTRMSSRKDVFGLSKYACYRPFHVLGQIAFLTS